MAKPKMKNLHVPLPEPTYRSLRLEAERSERPATELAREAIDRWLAQRHRQVVREAIEEYAANVAGTPSDLDEELEAAALELLLPSDSSSDTDP